MILNSVTITRLTSMLLINGNVCLYRKNPVRLVMIKLIKTIKIYAKARAKLKALARIAPFMNIKKKRVLMKAFFMAQFSYCPLTWMFHSRKLNNKINKLHERCLRIVYSDNTSSFEELLETDNSVSVHHRNIQVLATELYKIVNGF